MMEPTIIQQVKDLFAGADERNWQKVENTMSATVLLDDSSMTGNPAASLTPEEISSGWAAFLPGFDRTHHELSGFTVQTNDDLAMVHYTGHAIHYIDDEVWMVDGTYDTQLKLIDGTWLITAHTLNFIQQSGNTELPAKASQIMKAKGE